MLSVAVPGDSRVASKKNEWEGTEISGFSERALQVKVKVVPVVMGSLGTIPWALEKHLKERGTSVRVELLQKAALLATARILRKTLEILGYGTWGVTGRKENKIFLFMLCWHEIIVKALFTDGNHVTY